MALGSPQHALYLDENVDERLADALRRYGYDVQTVTDAHRKGQTDEAQLTHAARTARILISHDIADFVDLHRQWMEADRDHHGLMLTSEFRFRSLLQRVLATLDRFDAEGMRNQLIFP